MGSSTNRGRALQNILRQRLQPSLGHGGFVPRANWIAIQKAFSRAMSRARITEEWVFKEVKVYFAMVDYKRKLKVNESPIGLLYLSSKLLCNF